MQPMTAYRANLYSLSRIMLLEHAVLYDTQVHNMKNNLSEEA